MKELLKQFLRLAVFILFIFSCTVNAPQIKDSQWDITIVKDLSRDLIYEELSLFLYCYDEDGENDIETLMFIDDKNQFYWEIDRETWDVKVIDDIKWIGSASLVMPDRSAIPRVPIRLFVRDMAGEDIEDKIYITKQSIDGNNLTFPELHTSPDTLSIKNYTTGIIYLYSDNKLSASGEISESGSSFNDIFGKNRREFGLDVSYYISVYDKDKDLILKSGPWAE